MGPMGAHGAPMGPHGAPWGPMGPYGAPMGPHGVPWGPLGLSYGWTLSLFGLSTGYERGYVATNVATWLRVNCTKLEEGSK